MQIGVKRGGGHGVGQSGELLSVTPDMAQTPEKREKGSLEEEQ